MLILLVVLFSILQCSLNIQKGMHITLGTVACKNVHVRKSEYQKGEY